MSKIPEWRQKRRKAMIAVCTLGLSAAPWGLLFESSAKADKGLSFEGGAFGFIFRCIWFVVFTALTTLIVWVVSIFRALNYSIAIWTESKKK